MKPGTQIATEYAQIYQIEAQKEGKSDADFRGRVAGAIRDKGDSIEAHEAFNNELYDESEDVMTSLIGVATQALQNKNYGSTGERQIDDDFAAGVLVQAPKKEIGLAELMLTIAAFDSKPIRRLTKDE